MLNAIQSNQSISICACYPPAQCTKGEAKCLSTVGCFYSTNVTNNHVFWNERLGCFSNTTDNIKFLCQSFKPDKFLFKCCSSSETPLCNIYLRTNLTSHVSNDSLLTYSNLLLFMFMLLFLTIALAFKLGYSKSGSAVSCKTESEKIEVIRSSTPLMPKDSNSAGKPVETGDSGSGSGTPFLVQQTIARQTTLTECIGKGRFGEVWRATCQGEEVAVKIFSSRDGSSWSRETQIYNTGLLRHPNLLTYYASDIISKGSCTQMWLITAFHALGSLHDFLQIHTLTVNSGLRFARSIAAGLAFLHLELSNYHTKPAIAHRDVKSKNILLLDNGETCLADLGLALINTNYQSGWNRHQNSQEFTYTNKNSNEQSFNCSTGPPPTGPLAGTKRYMAPELLALYPLLIINKDLRDQSEESNDIVELSELLFHCQHPLLAFETYLAADIYGLGLVFWEIARRIKGMSPDTVNAEEYQLPYFDTVPMNPTFMQMFRVIILNTFFDDTSRDSLAFSVPLPPIITCERCSHITLSPVNTRLWPSRRPSISDRWLNPNSGLQKFSKLIQECWNPVPTNRLSALRVRKSLEEI